MHWPCGVIALLYVNVYSTPDIHCHRTGSHSPDRSPRKHQGRKSRACSRLCKCKQAGPYRCIWMMDCSWANTLALALGGPPAGLCQLLGDTLLCCWILCGDSVHQQQVVCQLAPCPAPPAPSQELHSTGHTS